MNDLQLVDWILLGIVAFLAGNVNAIAGGGSLLTFPALVAVGLPPVSANVTNSVALVPGYGGGVIGYRAELQGQRHRVRSLTPVAVVGAIVGAVVLLTTPDAIFDAIVPVLVLGASVLLLAQPILQRRLTGGVSDGTARHTDSTGAGVLTTVFVSAVYGGYFGGVLGVILLAALGLALHEDFQRLNALKGVLQFAINLAAVGVFVFFAPVQWWVVALMAPLSAVGGWTGSRMARRIPATRLRLGVGVLGIVFALLLAVF